MSMYNLTRQEVADKLNISTRSVDRYINPTKLKQIFVQTGLSKILVYRENIDNVIGFVSIQQLFNNYKNFNSIIEPVEFIPEPMFINELLKLKSNILMGGGDTLDIVTEFKNRINKKKNIFVSTGGGALLEYLETGELKGLKEIL